MPRKKNPNPNYQYHVSGQARVYLDGRYFYLGQHDTPASYAKYHSLLAIYSANGMTIPDDAEQLLGDAPITVRCLTAEFREYAKNKYAKDRSRHAQFKNLCTLLDDCFGDLPADEFGPRKLNEIRELLIATKNRSGKHNARSYINMQVQCIVKIFRYCVSRELVGPNVIVALATLQPLAHGESKASESAPVQPVDIETVRKTAKFLSPQIKAMVCIQASTGMRPSEVCAIRPTDIERRDDGVWVYRPPKHKTSHRGKLKAVPLLDAAKSALEPFLDRPEDDYCFKPEEAAEWHRERRHANRKTPLKYGNRPGYGKTSRNGTRKPRKYSERYTPDSYRQAITRAAESAKVAHWFPYQLRHLAATVIREALGVEAAQAMLGHSKADMTQHYAKQNLEKAVEAAKVAPKV
ncbi:tyrosine-type recombinase/integrase [Roseiconus lacunae]|uniref:Site-specific integrase n=1 Tax=Roseiconus lacunae TaxID=2605694 RepID=A0ABT7PDX2_9BACT|nr:site-specific integrase [Roseiconus lacunae]MDM4014697.1 site-specific integrase [Roseiconus lacunae]